MSMLFNEQPLVLNVDLAMAIGLNEAIVLQQLHYWVKKGVGVEHEGLTWVYNTHQEWQKQFPFWSTDTIKRALASLSSKGLIRVEKLNKAKHDHTNYYAIDLDQVGQLKAGGSASTDECKLPSSDECKLPPSDGANCPILTENTTENTTESKSSRRQQADSMPAQQSDRVPYAKIVDLYNRICGSKLPQCLKLNEKRKRQIKACWNLEINGEHPFRKAEFWEGYFNDCLANNHWVGENDRGWTADIEFLTRQDKVLRVLEGC